MDKYETARSALLSVCVFTAINLVLAVLGSSIYFIYAAQIPQYILIILYNFFDLNLYACLAIALIPIALLGICWYLSEKNNTWLLVSIVLFGFDTIFAVLGLFSLFSNFDIYVLIDGIISVIIMYTLIVGYVKGLDHWSLVKRKRPDPSAYQANREIVIDMNEDNQ